MNNSSCSRRGWFRGWIGACLALIASRPAVRQAGQSIVEAQSCNANAVRSVSGSSAGHVMTYYASGKIQSLTDPLGNVTTYVYDPKQVGWGHGDMVKG